MERRHLQRPLLTLLSAGAMLALGACAQTGTMASQDVSTLSPLQLVGLTVQSADLTRTLGQVDDLILAPDNRVEQVIVGTGSPMYPTPHRVVVNTADLRYAPNRQAVILVGMTPTEFAALPMTGSNDRMLSMGPTAPMPGGPMTRTGAEPTNWTGATVRR
ncbi:PRC-barrel domain containing protein [Azospirillum doebereinerae]|uniref:PRC-barrel domain containing protein n=1 Tax=Azospirillum doebereinerae TaxID=92933 RepID=A0A433IZC5_9PROT|nr:PRC-barrel domain containing protein [Azospirillum doebereinerae]MCG5240876.1 PRC-barrel domain containing protein [Azospirillum doebereinerae]RUQ60156.1 PRC-barrel domain containing protein [Azospirillum doebereinerae]